MGHMDPRQAELLQAADPAELGQRIKNARLARGLTQTELAGDDVSTGYVSRIESGLRRPNAKVLTQLATRLGTTVEELLGAASPAAESQVRLALDFAELALETGDTAAALDQSADALEQAEEHSLTELVERGHFVHARALESLGHMDDAILELEPLVKRTGSGRMRLTAGIALSRCYRESGDLHRAVEVADRLLEEIEDTPLEATDEAIQLTATLAGAHYVLGDMGQAIRVCRSAIARAEELGSPVARASAYWNASMFEADRGALPDALSLAQHALTLLHDGGDARNLARLRLEIGRMQLEIRPPQIDEAYANLLQASQEFEHTSASQIDRIRAELGLAEAKLLSGRADEALTAAVALYRSTWEQHPVSAANAKLLEGQAWAAAGDMRSSVAAYQQAVMLLTGVGADRSVANLWYHLARLLEEAGEQEEAIKAYRSAAASAGLVELPTYVRQASSEDVASV